jgi:hypothetical protein
MNILCSASGGPNVSRISDGKSDGFDMNDAIYMYMCTYTYGKEG